MFRIWQDLMTVRCTQMNRRMWLVGLINCLKIKKCLEFIERKKKSERERKPKLLQEEKKFTSFINF